MSQQTPEQTKDGGEDRVKRALRDLRKVQAPWYFESRLQRALRAGNMPRPWVKRPVPAFALSLLGIALVGAAGYYFYSHSDIGSPDIQKEESQLRPQVSEPPVTPSPSPRQDGAVPVVVPESAGSRQRGQAESEDQSMSSTVQRRFETSPRPREKVVTKPSDATSSPDRDGLTAKSLDTSSQLQGSMTSKSPDTNVQQLRVLPEIRTSGVTTRRDSVKPVDTPTTRKDTSKARRDSLQRSLPQSPLK